ncbi:very-short-patch-repair endonuclease [Scopulibacillus daqui]|uniref:Very-short-patch-repair endonuclease n=1 Tax=Scopulibacillus daqui TaxID=1469162 RepID=A0ABS2Q1I4_9BACL|nr:hypothetical protein [Scopulibacillus daqui]MBM7646076.1 very-short-patch-repair endonuclease [Scopulibacillus daqui]
MKIKHVIIKFKKWLYDKFFRIEQTDFKKCQPQNKITSLQNVIFETLKMQGFEVKINEPIGPYIADLYLPEHNIIILCLYPNENKTLQMIKLRKLSKYTRTCGFRVLTIDSQRFYKDLQKVMMFTHFSTRNPLQKEK